jgi:hypothetical protein
VPWQTAARFLWTALADGKDLPFFDLGPLRTEPLFEETSTQARRLIALMASVRGANFVIFLMYVGMNSPVRLRGTRWEAHTNLINHWF